jgi:hypothetical protein
VGAKKLLSIVLVFAFALTCLSVAMPGVAAPQPALVTKAWEFKFTHATPRPIVVKNLRGENEWYWYMTYKVVNNSGQERLFVPEITIATDQGDILAAGKNVRTAVFEEIKKRVGNRLLESPTNVVSQILQGEDHAKESVAIWPALDHNVDRVSIFISGLSGETALIKIPDPADTKKTIDTLVAKTLMLDFDYPGAPTSPQEQPVIFKGSTWIMR